MNYPNYQSTAYPTPYPYPSFTGARTEQYGALNTSPVGFKCIPVTSQNQAETFQIPFDGSTTYFVDTSNGKIYSKTFDMNTGMAPVVVYAREVDSPVIRYATIDDLNALRDELISKKEEVK